MILHRCSGGGVHFALTEKFAHADSTSSAVVLRPYAASPQAKQKRADAAMSELGKYSGNELKNIPVSIQKLSLANMDCLTFNMAVEEATRLGYAASVNVGSDKVLLSRESCANGASGR